MGRVANQKKELIRQFQTIQKRYPNMRAFLVRDVWVLMGGGESEAERHAGQGEGVRSGVWQWLGPTGEVEAAVRYTVNAADPSSASVHLGYSLRSTGERVHYSIRLLFTTPQYGGLVWWFACPLAVNNGTCGRRVRKLFLPPGRKHYGCRHCHALRYRSRNTDRKHRSLAKIQALRMRLGGAGSIIDAGLPDKPRGMSWRRYMALHERATKLEAETWAFWTDFAGGAA